MVPSDFHDFFLAAAGVHGALLGLLFVAISVSEWQGRFRGSYILAGLGLLGLADTLFTSLVALVPDARAGQNLALLAAGFGGLTVYLIWGSRKLSERRQFERIRFVGVMLLIGLVIQVSSSIALAATPGGAQAARFLAFSLLIVDICAIVAAWFLLIEPRASAKGST